MIRINLMSKPFKKETTRRLRAAYIASLKLTLFHAKREIEAQAEIIKILERRVER